MPTRPVTTRTWVALGIVYVIWGSTYLAIRVVVRTLPALGAMGSRFLMASLILAAIIRWRVGPGALRITKPQLRSSALVGVLLLVFGNGGVAVAEKTVPSGLAALLVAATPLWLVLLRTVGRDRPHIVTVLGTLIGFVGIAVLARPGGHGTDVKLWGIGTILVGTFCWATGIFLSQRLAMPENPFVAAVYEMAAGGSVMVVASLAIGELRGFSFSQVEAAAWWSLAYLVVFGSLVAFSAFVWLTRNTPISLVSTYAYVNPIVAVFLGWALLDESVSVAIAAGGALAVLGVLLVVRGERR